MSYIENENEKDDFFNSEVPEEKPKPPKPPVYKPDDPRYWDRDESDWDYVRPDRKRRFYVWLCVAGVVLGLILAGWFRWLSPSVEEADAVGYMEEIHKEGLFFKTYEGTLLPYREMMDTARVYDRDFTFSTVSDSLAVILKRMERSGRPVRLVYRKFRATVPWRGASVVEVVSVDSVNPSTLLPPDRAPEYVPGVSQPTPAPAAPPKTE